VSLLDSADSPGTPHRAADALSAHCVALAAATPNPHSPNGCDLWHLSFAHVLTRLFCPIMP